MPAISGATNVIPRVDDFLPMGRLGDSNDYNVQTGSIAGLAGRAHLLANYSAGSTSINVSGVPKNMDDYQGWVVIDPYTNECEIRRIANVTGNQLTIGALSYNHNGNDPVIFTDMRTIYVSWFGAKGDGVTNDTIPINRALSMTFIIGSRGRTRPSITVLLSPEGEYIVTTLLLWDLQGVIVDGGGSGTGGALIHGIGSDRAIMEIIGTQDVEIRNLGFWGDQTYTPACGTWTGRSNSVHGVNSSNITFKNINYVGYYTKCLHYCVSSESNHFYECWSYPYGNTGMDSLIHVSSTNDLNITPAGGTLDTHNYGNNDMEMQNCGWASGIGWTCIKVNNYCQVKCENSYLYSVVGPTIELIDNANFYGRGIGIEGAPDVTIKITAVIATALAPAFYGLNLHDCWLGTPNHYGVYADDNCILNGSNIVQNWPGLAEGGTILAPWRLAGVEGSNIEWHSHDSRDWAVEISGHYSAWSTFNLPYTASITWTNGAYSHQDVVITRPEGSSGGPNIRAGSFQPYNHANSKALKDIRKASFTWDIPNTPAGGSQFGGVSMDDDVQADGTWFCMVTMPEISYVGGYVVPKIAAGYVYVIYVNNTGGDVNPGSGTCYVTCIKVG